MSSSNRQISSSSSTSTSSSSRRHLINNNNNNNNNSPPHHHHLSSFYTINNNPSYRNLASFTSRLHSHSHSPSHSHSLSHSPIPIPSSSSHHPSLLPQSISSINHHLPLYCEYPDRPDSRQSQSTALPIKKPITSSSLSQLGHPTKPSSSTQQPFYSSLKNLHIWNEDWPRQWGWTGIDIPVHGIKALRNEVELSHASQLDSSSSIADKTDDDSTTNANANHGEVLSCSFASDRWKVEVVKRPPRRPSAPPTPSTNSPIPLSNPSSENLSLYLTCHELEVDWPTSRSISTSILISIKEPRIPVNLNPITNLGTSSEGWIWRVCCEERSFERESEVWECHTFPSLSTLLENPRVALYDSFVITIQIATPSTVSLPQIPHSSYIPHSLLQGLESLIDDQNTADLQILVTEYDSAIPLSSSGKPNPPKFRKRILYAHTGILKSRSEYFRAMLSDDDHGGWAESGKGENRKLGLVKIEDFDFNCVYWLMRWLYSNRIFFVDQEDVRAECYLGSTLTNAAYTPTDLPSLPTWAWCTYADPPADNPLRGTEAADTTSESVNSDNTHDVLETVSESGILSNTLVNTTPRVAIASSSSARGRPRGLGSGPTSSSPASSSASRRRSFVAHSSNLHGSSSSARELPGRSGPASTVSRPSHSHDTTTNGSVPPHSASFNKLTHCTNPPTPTKSPTRARHPSNDAPAQIPDGPWISGEPHRHPVTLQAKASALSIYRLAHRYELASLQEVALTHLVANLTPATAFPLLLASFVFPELHAEIKAYCLANYYAILQEPEFSRCYAEVGEGLWEHGGELMPGPNSSWYA